jgi:hypothetical protein
MTQPKGAHLVGSVNYDDAEKTMRTAAAALGGRLRRIPDGEVGKRFHWIMFQPDVIGQADGIERVGDQPIPFKAGIDARPLRIAEGTDAASIELPALGYADAAIESYSVFTRLRDEGTIAAGTRFQVSLPTPVGVVSSFFSGDDRDPRRDPARGSRDPVGRGERDGHHRGGAGFRAHHGRLVGGRPVPRSCFAARGAH